MEEEIRADLTVTTCAVPSGAFPGLQSWHAHEATLASFDTACNTALSGMRGPHGNNVLRPLMRVRIGSSSRSASVSQEC